MSSTQKITKRKVTMRTASLLPNGELASAEAVTYVRPNFDGEPEDSTGHLDAFVADARTRWQHVEVSEKPDAGPAGWEGDTVVGAHLVGKRPEDFDRFGDASTPENALDELLEQQSQRSGISRLGKATLMTMAMFLSTTLIVRVGVALAVYWSAMAAILTVVEKNAMATNYTTRATHAALFSTQPNASGGTELSGGSPVYARKVLAWGSPTNGVVSATAVTFDVPSGATVAGGGFYDALTGGVFRDGGNLTSQLFSSQGTYVLTPTYTQT